MKNMQKKAMILFVAALLTAPAAFASGWGWWNNNNNNNNNGGCNDVPLDGGISLLAAAGVGYGIKKVADKRKKNQQNAEK
ncbi:MAG: hypothetical protein JNL72_13455 [Flavipsychrobacter sp.]|nr:hypothetical protein [Flavipsychrobacter sp.]